MPSTKTAEREMRVAERRLIRNKSVRSKAKTDITKAEKLIFSGEVEAARAAVLKAISALDKAAGKGVLHRNNAARRKSRLVQKLNKATKQAQTAPAAPVKAKARKPRAKKTASSE